MFLESKTTALIDSLEIGALKFLNAVTERAPPARVAHAAAGSQPRAPAAPRGGAGTARRSRLGHEGLQERPARAAAPRAPSWRHGLNLVPMIDMMVILVFFLIFTAVFSRTNILELNLPTGDNSGRRICPRASSSKSSCATAPSRYPTGPRALLRSLPNAAGDYDLKGLSAVPEAGQGEVPRPAGRATILLTPAIPYDVLVQVMDTVRIYEVPGSSGWRAGRTVSQRSPWGCPDMTPTRVKQHRKRKHTTEGHLVLVPFIDMMTILVVFLLLHTADVDILPNAKDISIPQSVSQIKPHETLVVMVTRDSLYRGGQAGQSLAEVTAVEGNIIAPLKAALPARASGCWVTRATNPVAAPRSHHHGRPDGALRILQKVMATCTSADFGKVSLAVLERERKVPLVVRPDERSSHDIAGVLPTV